MARNQFRCNRDDASLVGKNLAETSDAKSRTRATAAHVRLNRKICAAAEVGLQRMLEIVQSCRAEMSLVNISTAWHCLARMDADGKQACDVRTDPRIAMLQEQTKLLLSRHVAPSPSQKDDPHPRCVSTITWSCAKLRIHDKSMMNTLGDLGLRWLSLFKPFELANVLWGFAKLQLGHAPFFQAAHDHILQGVQLFSTRSLSMVGWAFATMRFRPCRGLLCNMTDAFVLGLISEDGEANPVTIANMVWALATARVHTKKEALLAIGNVASTVLKNFKAHELSITLWAFARLNSCHSGLFTKAANLLCQSQRLRNEIHTQGIANLLWAFARFGSECHKSGQLMFAEVLAALAPTCLRLLPSLSPVELSSSIWAVSKLVPCWGQQTAADKVLIAAAEGLVAHPNLLQGMSPHGACGVLTAYTEFFCGSRYAPAACQELVARLARLCADFGPELQQRPELADMDAVPSSEAPVEGGATADPATAGAGIPLPAVSCPGSVEGSKRKTTDIPCVWGNGSLHLDVPEGRPASSPQFASSSLEPAHVYSGFITPKNFSLAPPLAGGLAGGFGGQPAYVQVSSLLTASLACLQVPSISFIEEFTSLNADEQDDKHLDVAFEINAGHPTRVSAVAVEVHACNIKQDSWELAFPDDADAFGMFKLRLPSREKPWSLQLIIKDAEGRAVGEVASLSLPGKRMDKCRLTAQDFGSVSSSVTTAVGATSIASTGSSTPSFSSRGSDCEGSGAEQDL